LLINPHTEKEQDPEIIGFSNRNASWFNDNTKENAKMKAAATAVDSFLAQQAHIDERTLNPKEHLLAIENEVKRLFPHRFEQVMAPVVAHNAPSASPTAAPASIVSSVGRSTASVTGTKSGTNLAARLTPTQRQLGEKFQRSNSEYTLEVYAQELEKMGRLG